MGRRRRVKVTMTPMLAPSRRPVVWVHRHGHVSRWYGHWTGRHIDRTTPLPCGPHADA